MNRPVKAVFGALALAALPVAWLAMSVTSTPSAAYAVPGDVTVTTTETATVSNEPQTITETAVETQTVQQTVSATVQQTVSATVQQTVHATVEQTIHATKTATATQLLPGARTTTTKTLPGGTVLRVVVSHAPGKPPVTTTATVLGTPVSKETTPVWPFLVGGLAVLGGLAVAVFFLVRA